MRKGTGVIPPSFWKVRRPRVSLKSAVAAVAADREEV
jgi:hypothetical protein